MSGDLAELNNRIRESSSWVSLLRDEVGKIVVGQRYMVDRIIVGLLAGGHILVEGVPGLAKTLSVKTLSDAIKADFKRIQFTPDLLPADIIGTLIYNPKTAEFVTKKGPIFANIVLADEINRAPAKVQSALLEAMQEKQVTLGEETFFLPKPFIVIATQNPVDQEGTYSLPEAQVDRFMLKLSIDYPSILEEKQIMSSMGKTSQVPKVTQVISPEVILESRKLLDNIYIDDKVCDYIINIVFATRKPSDFKLDMDNFIQFGASPRATIALALASKAWAFLQGRGYVTPNDVKIIGMDVLRHRVIVTYEAEAEEMSSETVVSKILNTVPVP
ncbi:MAG: MoxR family ATPase [Puniceicoccales bacterium]|jgi:MoxR-like ATPase|nr:MoxR family ATPase [Puniceicoccales bacterium]